MRRGEERREMRERTGMKIHIAREDNMNAYTLLIRRRGDYREEKMRTHETMNPSTTKIFIYQTY